MKMNETWHKKNILGQRAPLEKRIAWHLAHQKNCGCRPVPKSVAAALKDKKIKTCTRCHSFVGAGPCPICWPGRKKRIK